MDSKTVKVGLIQMRCFRDCEASVARACELLEEAAEKGVQIACLPELFASDYFCKTEDASLFDLAEPIPGPTSNRIAEVARKTGMTIIASLFEKRASGLYHNTSIMLDEQGEIAGKYRKMHIPDDPLFYEKFYFTPGDLGFQAFDTKHAKLGMLVCWDQWYPEAARLTAMQGAEILFYPTAIGWLPADKAEYGDAMASMWETVQRSHAVTNGCFVTAVNRVGHENVVEGAGNEPVGESALSASDQRAASCDFQEKITEASKGITFWGSSFIADPYGRVLAKGSVDQEEVVVAEIDLSLIEDTRRNWPFLRDRRIDAYDGITKRFGNE